jgi:hypothetical protein
MSTSARLLFALVLGAFVAGPAWARKDDPAAELAKLTEGRVAGKPQRCINLPSVTDTRVIDKTTIVYRIGNINYVNQVKSGASALDDDDIAVTHTSGSQLCELDTVKMADRYGGGLRGFAILGPFVPYKAAPAKP